MTIVRATLKLAGQTMAFGTPVHIDPTGLEIAIDVPANVSLERAELRIEAPDDSVELDLQSTITTSSGALDTTKSVDWISAEWGVRRPITFVRVKSGASKGRIKVSEGGPWFPPLPFDVLTLNNDSRLSGVTATRLLVEPLDNEGKNTATATFDSMTIKVGARPPDFFAAIGTDAPFYHYPLLLRPNEALVLRDELTDALRRAWPSNFASGSIRLSLRSSARSIVQNIHLSLTTCTVVTAFDNAADNVRLSLAPGESANVFIAEPPPGPLESISFAVRCESRPEIVPILPNPEITPLVAHLVGAGYRAAQAISTPETNTALAGVDIFLKPLTSLIRASLAIHLDTFGRPADEPFGEATANISIDSPGDPPRPAKWVKFDFPAPIPVGNQAVWIILDIPDGEALWLLGNAPNADPKTALAFHGALFRANGDGVWREREPPPEQIAKMPQPIAYARPRFHSDKPPVAPVITLQWGTTTISAAIGNDGRVNLEAKALEALTRPDSGDKRIRISVSTNVAAVITFSALDMRIPWSGEF